MGHWPDPAGLFGCSYECLGESIWKCLDNPPPANKQTPQQQAIPVSIWCLSDRNKRLKKGGGGEVLWTRAWLPGPLNKEHHLLRSQQNTLQHWAAAPAFFWLWLIFCTFIQAFISLLKSTKPNTLNILISLILFSLYYNLVFFLTCIKNKSLPNNSKPYSFHCLLTLQAVSFLQCLFRVWPEMWVDMLQFFFIVMLSVCPRQGGITKLFRK